MEYEADGTFWLDPAEKIRGRVSFTQQAGGELRLEGVLVGEGGNVLPELEVIRGTALDGTELCLLDAFPVQLRIGAKGVTHPHRFYVNRLLIGTEDYRQPVERIRLEIRGLSDFIGESGLVLTAESGDPDPDQPISMEWRPLSELPSVRVADLEIELIAEHRFTADDYEFVLEHRAGIELRGSGRDFDAWDARAATLAGLITFFHVSPARIERMCAPLNDHQVELIFQHREGSEQPAKGGPWVTLQDIREEFDRALQGWFAFAESDPEAFEVLNEYLRFGRQLVLQDRLLYLARVIELYHRGGGRFEQLRMPREEHQARKREIIGSTPEPYREWLTQALARSNEKTLRERLVELVESFDEAIRPIVGDVDDFAALATNSRNYFTHYSASLMQAGKVADGMELYWLTHRLLFLVRACCLREMGFDNGRISQLLRGDRSHDALVRMTREAGGSAE